MVFRVVGGVIYVVDRVLDGKNRSVFVCCRSFGYYVGINGVMEGVLLSGFFILNNVMIGMCVFCVSDVSD